MIKKLVLLTIILVFCSAPAGPAQETAVPDTKARLLAALTPDERAWLEEHPVIRVGGPLQFPPFHFHNESGHAEGIGPDYVAAIARIAGVRVEYQKPLPWPQVLEKAKNRELDVIACAAKSPEREAYLNFSNAFLFSPMMIITRKDAPFVGGLGDLYGLKLAVIEKVATGEWLKRDGIKAITFAVETPLAALQAVRQGQADAAIENLAAASYLIQKHSLLDLKIAAPTLWDNYQLFFAVRQDWPVLVSIIDKALAVLPQEEQAAVRNKWISVQFEYGISPWDVLKWIAVFLAPAGLIIIAVLLHNRRLRREIVERRRAEAEREQVIGELKNALANIKQLKGLLPICSSCKKIRSDEGYWHQVEEYVMRHSDAQFSHSICPDCLEKLYPEYLKVKEETKKDGKAT